MPNHDIADHTLIAALQDAFGTLDEDDHVDIVAPDDSGEADVWEVQADSWTLVLEGWPLANAWIAIDDDPSSPEQFRTALEATLDDRDIAALARLNDALDGMLATSLEESADDLSIALAALVTASESR